MTDGHDDFMRGLLATFRSEAKERLQHLMSLVIALEQARPAVPAQQVDQVLKELHTLKGAARAVGMNAIETLFHSLENVFSALLPGGLHLPADAFDVVHQAVRFAEQTLDSPQPGARNQAKALSDRLNRIADTLPPATISQAEVVHRAAPPMPEQALGPQDAEPVPDERTGASASSGDAVRVRTQSLDALRYQVESLLAIDLDLRQQIAGLTQLAEQAANLVSQSGSHTPGPAASGRSIPPGAAARKSRPASPQGMDPAPSGTVAEIARRCREAATALGRTSHRFNSIRTRLVEATLETSLAPFSSVLPQLTSLARNHARGQGKEVTVRVEDAGIQIDRKVLDIVREALIHLVTNALDHGIETPEKRLSAGKPASGTIEVKVSRSRSDRIAVVVTDDGAGMDVQGLLEAAVRAGRAPAEAGPATEQERLRLALLAGVSTSERVTPSSGRGVGLAVVTEKVESIGGALQIDSVPGTGCSFRLELPVRLATMRGLVLRAAGALYVLPLANVESARRVAPQALQRVENRETLEDAGRVMPAIRLRHLLGIDRSSNDEESVAIIAAHAGGHIALLVDDVVAEQEILPKSLGKQVRRIKYVIGVAQLGDQRLVPILGLSDVATQGTQAPARPADKQQTPSGKGSKGRHVLIAEDSVTSRMLLKHILENAGYTVQTAPDGLVALSELRHSDFDLLVSDVEMPNLDGLELTRRVRANPRTAELPVVLITTRGSPEEKERGLLAGADAYVVKGSFDQDNLLATVRRLA